MAAHFEDEHRQGQHEADPEPPRHVRKLMVWHGVSGDFHRLQRHAANGAASRADLADLGVHGAGKDGAGLAGFSGLRLQIAFRTGRELRPAACRAEMVGCPGVIEAMLRSRGIDFHPADRVRGRFGVDGLGREILHRVSGELCAAAATAEMVGDPLVLVPVLRGGRIDFHAADGVGDRRRRLRSRSRPATAATAFGAGMGLVLVVIAHGALLQSEGRISDPRPGHGDSHGGKVKGRKRPIAGWFVREHQATPS